MSQEYRVQLEIFQGPLDLLLYLIRTSEVDIRDIPIAQITEQYLKFMELFEALDLNVAGEFLVMASTLLEIKSRMLLPDEEREEEGDPREELVRQLLEYKKFKDAAEELAEKARLQEERFGRFPQEKPAPKADEGQYLADVEIWDLFSAFSRLMGETYAHLPEITLTDEVPLSHYMDELLRRVSEAERLGFEELFAPGTERQVMALMFIALLELVRQGKLRAEQERDFGPIYLFAL
jgi:segregation and condensation protein A